MADAQGSQPTTQSSSFLTGLKYRARRLLEESQRRVSLRRFRHAPYAELLVELREAGDHSPETRRLLHELNRSGALLSRHDTLVHLLEKHPQPHLVNYLLSQEEFRIQKEEVLSYPPNVQMDLASVCNVECRFCKYTDSLFPKAFVTLDQVKAIEWLKFVRTFSFSAGTGEALTNPKFLDIFDHVRSQYPHLHLSMLTNGRALTGRIVEALAGKLDQLHVSMNASSEAEYDKIVRKSNWDTFKRNMDDMAKILRNVKRPALSASFVITRFNIDRAVQHLEFAASHGASRVAFYHYYVHLNRDLHGRDHETLREKVAAKESLYYDRERSDEILGRVERRAKELGVEVELPVPFSYPKRFITYGTRSEQPVQPACNAPWTHLFLLWGCKSKREEIAMCCGLAADIGVYFDRDDVAGREGFRRTWNSPILRAYRRTVNGERINPVCRLCRRTDRFDPNSIYPDQRAFFEFVNLPIPAHFTESIDTDTRQVEERALKGTVP